MPLMEHPVVLALLPVVVLIAIGFIAGAAGAISAGGLKELSNLVFLVLIPALLFRTMAGVHVQELDFRPVAAYFLAALLIFAITLVWQGLTRRAAVMALAATFSNTTMIGVPLVSLAFGPAALVTLFTLISVHALILLTLATVALELALARERRKLSAADGHPSGWSLAVFQAVRSGVLHPVPLPIIAGLLFAQTGWSLPPVIDKPLAVLGAAFGPMALLLVGASLNGARVGQLWRPALTLALIKNGVFPVLVLALAAWWGVRGTTLAVLCVAASLPIGANVFMFSQRYQVAQEEVTAAVALSTLLALGSTSAVLALLG